MPEHLIGLMLGAENDWPTAFESLMRRAKLDFNEGGERHTFNVERVTVEPFNLRDKPRHRLVIDRAAWWYNVPREWLKKVAMMDEVYLPNNPFTFQAMEKHTAYCVMMRLGLRIPETWMLPMKVGPSNERFETTAKRYNKMFDLDAIAEKITYPLFMKPFDGGGWRGVTRINNREDLHKAYNESGQSIMHLQKGIPDFDHFARSLTIGPQTRIMRYRPDRPQHERYETRLGFLNDHRGERGDRGDEKGSRAQPGDSQFRQGGPASKLNSSSASSAVSAVNSLDLEEEILMISRLINAYFRWEFNSCETIVKDGVAYPIDYANATPDVAITSLHVHFPWAMTALLKWSVFCASTKRLMSLALDHRRYFKIADRTDLNYDQKLKQYFALTQEYFETERFEEFCGKHLSHIDEMAQEYFASPEFDVLLMATVAETFPAHERDHFNNHYRQLISQWSPAQATV